MLSSLCIHYLLNTAATTNTKNTKTKSVKLFSHGRGLSAHIHAVHTPWNPGKVELKRRIALHKRLINEEKRKLKNKKKRNMDEDTDTDVLVDRDERSSGIDDEGSNKRRKLIHQTAATDKQQQLEEGNYNINNIKLEKWTPTQQEINEWNIKVMEIVSLVEAQSKKKEVGDSSKVCSGDTKDDEANSKKDINGTDRSGNVCPSYRDSLPPFLAAAANGDLVALQAYVKEDGSSDDKSSNTEEEQKQQHIKGLLSLRDRNGSTAEHWAAGGGHLDCLSYLLELRYNVASSSSAQTQEHKDTTPTNNNNNKKIRRRRDGKTSLHYAARNGHNHIIDYLLSSQRKRQHDIDDTSNDVDIPSGDGTTPLHLACYGGHLSTVQHLIQVHNANVFTTNEWDCSVAHWTAMSLGLAGKDAVIELCNYLHDECGVDFGMYQKQGHTALHKAASRKNKHVIEWLATKFDNSNSSDNDKNDNEEEKKKSSIGLVDVGGNKPSDIWQSVGGDEEFGLWMKNTCGW